MDPITTRRPSTPDQILRSQTRNVEAGTGADGEPLVFTIRRIPVTEADEYITAEVGKDLKSQAAYLRRIASRGLVTKVSFEANAEGPSWDDLSFPTQAVIAAEILRFTTAGMKEAGEYLASFRSEQENGTQEGAARARPDPAGSDDDVAARVAAGG